MHSPTRANAVVVLALRRWAAPFDPHDAETTRFSFLQHDVNKLGKSYLVNFSNRNFYLQQTGSPKRFVFMPFKVISNK